MKKVILLFLITCIYSCVCNNNQVSETLINSSDKAFLNNEIKEVKFIDQDGNNVLANYDNPNFQLFNFEDGPESCGYHTIEQGIQKIKIGKYEGIIGVHELTQLTITLDNFVAKNYVQIINVKHGLENNTQNIEILDTMYNNVLVLENPLKEGIWDVEKILYSKENGIELILFKNGNWYKRNNL